MKSHKRYAQLIIPHNLVEFVKAHYKTTTDKELLGLINQNEEWSWVDFSKLRHIKWLHQFIKQVQVPYTEDEKQFIRDNYLKMGDVGLAEQLPNHTFKSVHKQRRVIMGLHRDKESRFVIQQKGSKKAHEAIDRMKAEGTYHRSLDRKVGEIYRVNCTGYWYIKPDEKRLYRPVAYHRWLWQKEVGKIPKGYLVRFKNGAIPDDYKEITIDSLECVPYAEHAQKVANNMSDLYIAGTLRCKSKGLDIEDLKETGLIELKRNIIKINKKLKIKG